ncbi:MAG: HYR domain-containing protein [Saprospiraceae bacterium]|nr:HYR domain-containing protein [Saprospiraceae bacterium]
MFKNLLLAACILSVFNGVQLQAQGVSACGGLNFAFTCASSCISCDLEGLTGTTGLPQIPGANPNLCHDAIIIDNPHFYGFIAGSTNLILEINLGTCYSGTGLEAAILDNCNNGIVCVPGPVQLNLAGSFFLQLANLTVGHPYQLVIDGYQSSQCTYTIHVFSGSTTPPPVGPIGSIAGNAQVCPNGTATYTIPPVDNAVSYTWSAPVGASINGGGNVRVLPAQGNNSVDITFGNSGGNVCVSASNVCSPPVTACMSVSNVPIPINVLPEEIVCYQQIPYEWPEEPHNILAAPGTYTLTSTPYQSYLGCDSTVRQTLRVLPLNYTNLPVKYLCKDECFEINGLTYCETGSYQEILSSFAGCDSLVNFTLVRIQSKAVVQPPDTITCEVTSVPLSGVGSTTGNTVSYRWIDGDGQTLSNSITAIANAPGQYALIVTNFVGGVQCKDTAWVQVPGNLTTPQANAGPDMVLSCAVPQVQLQGSGSVGPNFTYFWKSLLGGNIVMGSTTLTPTVNAPGTYSLRVTNLHNGCTAVSNVTVTAQVLPPTVNAAGGALTCAQPNIPLQLTTNAQNPSFSWAGPNGFTSNQQNPMVGVAGTYTVTVTNGVTGCTNTGSVSVVDNTNPPGVTATGGDITCIQLSVALNASSSTMGVTYQWSGPNGFSSNLPNPTATVVGDYQVVARAPNGCTSTAVATVALNNAPPGTTLSSSANLNCNNNAVNLLATSNDNLAFLTHQWTLPGGGTTNTGNQAFLQVNTPGAYSVSVVNTSTGCSSVANYNLVQYDPVVATAGNLDDANCAESADGSATVAVTGGNGVYTYQWNNGATTATNAGLGAGNYSVTVSDSDGCSSTAVFTIGAPVTLNAGTSGTDQSANGTSDGSASANPTGGTPTYNFVWSTGSTDATLSGLLPGAYTVTVTDANGCSDVETVNVSPYDCTLQTTVNVANISCFGEVDGTAGLDIVGGTSPFTILWSNGETSNSIDSLPAGQYSVSITDAANCPEVQTFTILEPQALQANAVGSTTSGANTNDGTASASPTGGTGNYTYNWSNGETTASLTNLAPGAYRITVTDENGCSSQQTVEVLPGSCGLITDLIQTSPNCPGANNGAVTLVITGGNGNFTYAWSTGGAAATEENLFAGTHQVTVTDDANCQVIVTVELLGPAPFSIVPDAIQSTSCASNPEGSIALSVSGGTGNLSVSWSNGQNGLNAVGLIAGPYTATVQDENGCVANQTFTVLSTDTEVPSITANNSTVSIGQNGQVVLSVQNTDVQTTDNCGQVSVSYEPAVFSCTQLGEHVVIATATDDSGNTASQTLTVTVVDNTPPSLICSPSLVLCFEDNPVTYQAPTASDNCFILGGSFNIVEGLPIGAVFPVGSTTTTYQYTDSQGNVGTCSFEVTILPEFLLDVDTVINDFNFQTLGAVFIDVEGSLPPYTYSWTLNGVEVATTQDLSGVPGGDYTIVVTDDNGCTVSQNVTVENTSSVKIPTLLNDIKVFPNPTAGRLNLLIPDELKDGELFLQVFDLTGRRVMEHHSVRENQVQLELGDLSDGLYSLIIRTGNDQVVKKVVLNR